MKERWLSWVISKMMKLLRWFWPLWTFNLYGDLCPFLKRLITNNFLLLKSEFCECSWQMRNFSFLLFWFVIVVRDWMHFWGNLQLSLNYLMIKCLSIMETIVIYLCHFFGPSKKRFLIKSCLIKLENEEKFFKWEHYRRWIR